MIISTKIDTSYAKFDLKTFQDFYDKIKWIIFNIDNTDLKKLRLYNFDSDIVKNRFEDFWEKNKDNKVSLRQIKYACNSKNCNVYSVDFYIERGWTEEEAIRRISKIQHDNSMKSAAKMTDDRNPAQYKYWMKKGLSEEEAKKMVSERQSMFSKEKCIEKYGEEKGLQVFRERQRKWQETLKSRYTKSEMAKWKKSFTGSSKESFNLFMPFYKELKEHYTCLFQNKEEKMIEYRIIDSTHDTWYYYDFTILELGLIFEYNGEHIHPNPSMSKEEWDKWRHCFSNETADEVYERYKQKIRIAEQNGFKVVQLWRKDGMNKLKEIIRSEISAKIQSLQQ